MTDSDMLGVFAKWPEPGAVKTRLGGSPQWGAEVARAFLHDLLGRLGNVFPASLLVYAPEERSNDFRALLPRTGWGAVAQGEGDLGVRLSRFFTEMLSDGMQRLVVIGTDSPTLPLAYISRAFELLGEADVVMGPATDGGYYLVGCAGQHAPHPQPLSHSGERKGRHPPRPQLLSHRGERGARHPPHPQPLSHSGERGARHPPHPQPLSHSGERGDGVSQLFEAIDWSSDRVLEQTIDRLPDGWKLALLPPWYDVDTPTGWAMLRGHVAAMRRAGEDPGIPHTEALLRRP